MAAKKAAPAAKEPQAPDEPEAAPEEAEVPAMEPEPEPEAEAEAEAAPEPEALDQLDARAISAAQTARINGTGLDGTGGTVMLGFGTLAEARGAVVASASRPAEDNE